jgi:NitT/TauT family transport system substrate-binding protein
MHRSRRLAVVATLAVGALGLVAPGVAGAAPKQGNVTLRLGYFPNVTHASAIVGVESGLFKEKLGNNVQLETSTFNAGPAAVEALNSDAIDATYIGPNPAINAYAQSNGEAIRIVSGATSGGAFLVVKSNIKGVKDLKGKEVASPQLGNTQDVALRTYLKKKGLKTDTAGGGDVSIQPQANGDALAAFEAGDIDGAWVPEPYASLLVAQGATKLVDEATLWPHGKFVTTHLLVNNDFLKAHPDLVDDLLQGQIKANDYIAANSDSAKTLVGAYIGKLTSSEIPADVLDSAWSKLTFTNDPIADSLLGSADHAAATGLLDPVKGLSDIYDLDPLNKLLAKAGEPQVSGPSQ